MKRKTNKTKEEAWSQTAHAPDGEQPGPEASDTSGQSVPKCRVWGGSPTSVFAARRDAKIASVATLALLAVSAYPGNPTKKRRQRLFLRFLRFSGFLYSLCGGFHDRQFVLVHCV